MKTFNKIMMATQIATAIVCPTPDVIAAVAYNCHKIRKMDEEMRTFDDVTENEVNGSIDDVEMNIGFKVVE